MKRILPPKGAPPPAHTHEGHEVFYVLDGRVEFRLGQQTVLAEPGRPHPMGARNASPTIAIRAPRVYREHRVRLLDGPNQSHDHRAKPGYPSKDAGCTINSRSLKH